MAKLPSDSNIIKAFIKKGDGGFESDGDLVLVSDDELRFPNWDGSSNVFYRAGSGLGSGTAGSKYIELDKQAPYIGMTASQVEDSTWGKPNDINKTTTQFGVNEQWVYSNDKYIYLEDGVVTAIQE